MNNLTKYAVLGSGSIANSYIFQVGTDSFVVDNGFSCRAFLARTKALGFESEHIRCLFLTHTHGDHVRGIERLSKTLRVPVYMGSEINLRGSVKKQVYKRINVEPGGMIQFESFSVTPFTSSHDSDGALGYRFDTSDTTCTIITDTGKITPEMHQHAFESDILFLESNYDVDLLKTGSYPKFLKDRIRSDHGHLSNADAVEFINDLALSPSLRKVYLCHLSKNNNSPTVVSEYLSHHLQVEIPITVCPRGEPVMGDPL